MYLGMDKPVRTMRCCYATLQCRMALPAGVPQALFSHPAQATDINIAQERPYTGTA